MVETRSMAFTRVSNELREMAREDRQRDMRRQHPQLMYCPQWQALLPDDFHDGGRRQLYEAIIRNMVNHRSVSIEFSEEPDCDNAVLVVVKNI